MNALKLSVGVIAGVLALNVFLRSLVEWGAALAGSRVFVRPFGEMKLTPAQDIGVATFWTLVAFWCLR